jgi:hypothetical protein
MAGLDSGLLRNKEKVYWPGGGEPSMLKLVKYFERKM